MHLPILHYPNQEISVKGSYGIILIQRNLQNPTKSKAVEIFGKVYI